MNKRRDKLLKKFEEENEDKYNDELKRKNKTPIFENITGETLLEDTADEAEIIRNELLDRVSNIIKEFGEYSLQGELAKEVYNELQDDEYIARVYNKIEELRENVDKIRYESKQDKQVQARDSIFNILYEDERDKDFSNQNFDNSYENI